MDPVIKYDSKADILSVKLLDSDILIDLNAEGEMVTLEVWDASKRGLYKTLVDLANEKRELIDTLLNKQTSHKTLKTQRKFFPKIPTSRHQKPKSFYKHQKPSL